MQKKNNIRKYYKIVVVGMLVLTIVVIIIPMIINGMFKKHLGIEWLVAEWDAGDALVYYGAVLTFLGTSFLGVVSLIQNNRIVQQNILVENAVGLVMNDGPYELREGVDGFILTVSDQDCEMKQEASISRQLIYVERTSLCELYLNLNFKVREGSKIPDQYRINAFFKTTPSSEKNYITEERFKMTNPYDGSFSCCFHIVDEKLVDELIKGHTINCKFSLILRDLITDVETAYAVSICFKFKDSNQKALVVKEVDFSPLKRRFFLDRESVNF